MFQNQRITQRSKSKTLVYSNETHYFVVNNPSANIIFKIFYLQNGQNELIYQSKVSFIDL